MDYLKVDNAEREFISRRKHYLRNNGWEHTANYPDHVWRWSKSIDGTLMALSEKDAFDLQKAIELKQFGY